MITNRIIELHSALGTNNGAFVAETCGKEAAADLFKAGYLAKASENSRHLKDDYWTCQHCGSDYDSFDPECFDPECQSAEAQLQKEFAADYCADDDRI